MRIDEKDMAKTEQEKAEKEKQRAEVRARIKAEDDRRRKEKEEKQKKDEERTTRQERYNNAKQRTEQMTREEFIKRRAAGESKEDLYAEMDRFATDQRLSAGANYSEPSTRELAEMEAAIHYGSPSGNSRIADAVRMYQSLEGEAKEILSKYSPTGKIDMDDPYVQNYIDMYIGANYNNPYVSLDDVMNTKTAMQNNNEEAWQVSQQKKEEEFQKAAQQNNYVDPVTGAPIEDYGYKKPTTPFKERFNEFMTTPNFNKAMQTGLPASNPYADPVTGAPIEDYSGGMNAGTGSTGYYPVK